MNNKTIDIYELIIKFTGHTIEPNFFKNKYLHIQIHIIPLISNCKVKVKRNVL